jgi:hypothetical protein
VFDQVKSHGIYLVFPVRLDIEIAGLLGVEENKSRAESVNADETAMDGV